MQSATAWLMAMAVGGHVDRGGEDVATRDPGRARSLSSSTTGRRRQPTGQGAVSRWAHRLVEWTTSNPRARPGDQRTDCAEVTGARGRTVAPEGRLWASAAAETEMIGEGSRARREAEAQPVLLEVAASGDVKVRSIPRCASGPTSAIVASSAPQTWREKLTSRTRSRAGSCSLTTASFSDERSSNASGRWPRRFRTMPPTCDGIEEDGLGQRVRRRVRARRPRRRRCDRRLWASVVAATAVARHGARRRHRTPQHASPRMRPGVPRVEERTRWPRRKSLARRLPRTRRRSAIPRRAAWARGITV